MPETNVVEPQTKVQSTGYSAEYVKELRDEAASWRTKLRETETRYQTLEQTIKQNAVKATVSEELQKRNLKVNPDWIKLEDGKTPKDAVDEFLKEYPQWDTSEPEPSPRTTQRAQTVKKTNTNIPSVRTNNVGELAKDPIARAKIRDHYRSLLSKDRNL